MIRGYMVGQSSEYYDHVVCMKRGQQIKFCVAKHFGNDVSLRFNRQLKIVTQQALVMQVYQNSNRLLKLQ